MTTLSTLTESDIDALQPGPETDALVLEACGMWKGHHLNPSTDLNIAILCDHAGLAFDNVTGRICVADERFVYRRGIDDATDERLSMAVCKVILKRALRKAGEQ